MYKIIYISGPLSSFINNDIDLISKDNNVISLQFYGVTVYLKSLCKFIYLLCVFRPHILYIRFYEHYYLPVCFFKKIFRYKTLVVLGGFDSRYIPSIKKYTKRYLYLRKILRICINNVDLFLPVSSTLIKTDRGNIFFNESHPSGLVNTYKVDENCINYTEVKNSINKSIFKNYGSYSNRVYITTVATITDESRFFIKGIDHFIRIANLFPSERFLIIGANEEFKRRIIDLSFYNNITIEGSMSQKELVDIYNRTKVYVQLSRVEGFPNVLIEAIQCGCVPVGSSVFGIPAIIDNDDLIVNEPTDDELFRVLHNANTIYDNNQYSNKSLSVEIDNEYRRAKLNSIFKEILDS